MPGIEIGYRGYRYNPRKAFRIALIGEVLRVPQSLNQMQPGFGTTVTRVWT